MSPLISVIIPSYNRAQLIEDAISSVLNQTYQNIEIIIVDDCSTDNTEEVVKNIKDNRIRFFKLDKNSGACIARNLGIENAAGDFIAFNDSDDKWHSDKLEKQYKFLTSSNADICVCGMDVYDENSSARMYSFPDKSKCTEGRILFTDLLNYNSTSTQLLFGKTECFKNERFDSRMPRFQDWELCLRLSKKYNLFFQNEVLVDTYQQKDSITKNPQKGVLGMNLLFSKYSEEILSDCRITESFFKKMSSFTCRTGKNPVTEMNYIYLNNRSFSNLVKLILAKSGIYKILFNLKNK